MINVTLTDVGNDDLIFQNFSFEIVHGVVPNFFRH